MAVTNYPLSWPVRNPRTKPEDRKPATAFVARNWDRSLKELHEELRKLGAEPDSVVISTNQPVRKDGQPFAQERRIDDPGVAVYFVLGKQRVCFPCDRYVTLAANLRAITLHIEAMRGQQRWGVGTSQQAFAGYAALPASTEEDWWTVLGCNQKASFDVIQTSYRNLARQAHPDAGGSEAAMRRLNTARDRALAEVRHA